MIFQLALAVAAGIGGKALYDKWQAKQPTPSQVASQHAFDEIAKSLVKGSVYMIQLMVDPTKPEWGGITDPALAAQLIQHTLEQYGWTFLESPALYSEQDRVHLQMKQPSQWILLARWNLMDDTMKVVPPWAGMMLPYFVPVKDPLSENSPVYDGGAYDGTPILSDS